MKNISILFSLLICFYATAYSTPNYSILNKYVWSYMNDQIYCKDNFSKDGLKLIKKYFRNPISICDEDEQLNTIELREAYQYYLSMAKKGKDNGRAAYLVGIANLFDIGVQNSTVYAVALKWLKKSADLGYPPGVVRYADVMQAAKARTMKSLRKYYNLRVEAYRKAAIKGIPLAYGFMINHYIHKNNTKMVAYWLSRAKQAGAYNNPSVMVFRAAVAFGNNRIDQAITISKQLLKNNNSGIDIVKRTLAVLGRFYATSKKYKDMNKALEYYRQAALLNDGFAQNQLGDMFYSGLMVKKNLKTANYWYCQAEKNVYMPTHSCKK